MVPSAMGPLPITNLEEEVPIWRLRLKEAQDRGAYLVVANARDTRLEDFALQGARNDKVVEGDAIRYNAGEAVSVMRDLAKKHQDIAGRLSQAENLVIVTGAEGLTLAGSAALAGAAANFLIDTGHVGRPDNGLLSPIPGANGMGLHYLGYSPAASLDIAHQSARKLLIVAQAELLDDDPAARAWLSEVETVIYANFFDDGISELADYVSAAAEFCRARWQLRQRRAARAAFLHWRKDRWGRRCPPGSSSAACGKLWA